MNEGWIVYNKSREETDYLFRPVNGKSNIGQIENNAPNRSVFGQIAQEVAQIIDTGEVAQLVTPRSMSPAIAAIRVRLILTRGGYEKVQTKIRGSENSAYFRLNLD